MNEDFWRSRWAANQIGFHQSEVHPRLMRHIHRVPAESRVLVPLSGKTLDMAWLADQGHRVVAVEFVESALVAFFEEQGIAYERAEDGAFVSPRIEAHARDVFDFGADREGTFDWIYDRAALVAIRREDRQRYADLMLNMVGPGKKILLITLAYDPAKMSGPPHEVSADEVHRLFAHRATVECLETENVIESEPRFKAKGHDWFEESVWLLTSH